MDRSRSREERIKHISKTCGWFRGGDYIAKAMALPQEVGEAEALLKVMGVQVELVDANISGTCIGKKYRFTNQKGKSRGMTIEPQFPWDDPWVVVAAVLYVQMYDGPDAGFC